jgi:2-polyprenyl-6-hydroxyphenyl methylase/3-demethylubiquinone-9 3-methyltransferase
MRRVHPASDWPPSWKSSYEYDLQEIYGEVHNPGHSSAYDNRRRHTFELVQQAVLAGSRVLDIGAAQGNFSLLLAEMGYDVTWNDLREELSGYVRLKHEHGTLHFAAGDAFQLRFPHQFDAVLITEIIEHVAHPDEFLTQVATLIRPGGFIVMTTPNGAYFRNKLPRFSDCPDPSVYESVQFKPDSDGHIFLLHTDEVYQISSQAGLLVDELRLFTNSLTSGHIKLNGLLGVLPKRLVSSIEGATQRLPARIANHIMVHMAVRLRKPLTDNVARTADSSLCGQPE